MTSRKCQYTVHSSMLRRTAPTATRPPDILRNRPAPDAQARPAGAGRAGPSARRRRHSPDCRTRNSPPPAAARQASHWPARNAMANTPPASMAAAGATELPASPSPHSPGACARLPATSSAVLIHRTDGSVTGRQSRSAAPCVRCGFMRMKYAVMNSAKNDVTTARNTHRPTRAGAWPRNCGRVAAVVGALGLPRLRGQAARRQPPDEDAGEQRDGGDDRVHTLRPCPSATAVWPSGGWFCGTKSSLLPGAPYS